MIAATAGDLRRLRVLRPFAFLLLAFLALDFLFGAFLLEDLRAFTRRVFVLRRAFVFVFL